MVSRSPYSAWSPGRRIERGLQVAVYSVVSRSTYRAWSPDRRIERGLQVAVYSVVSRSPYRAWSLGYRIQRCLQVAVFSVVSRSLCTDLSADRYRAGYPGLCAASSSSCRESFEIVELPWLCDCRREDYFDENQA